MTHLLRARMREGLRGMALVQHRNRLARRAVDFAVANAPFYADHWQRSDPVRWWRLPAVDKTAMMAHFARFNTAGVGQEAALAAARRAESGGDPVLGGLTAGLSSGTSGRRGLFLIGPEEQEIWAGVMLARTIHAAPRRPLRVAFFLRANNRLYQRVGGRLVRFEYFSLGALDATMTERLEALDPDVLIAPPSQLDRLLAGRQAGRLAIAPRRVFAVAEPLLGRDAKRLREGFGVPIVEQIYQATEGLLAISCRLGALHLQEDLVAIQLEQLPGWPGEPPRFTPLVTDLWRRVQPILRYRLGDVLRVSPHRCRCGSAWRVVAVEGRLDDVLRLPVSGGECWLYPETVDRALSLPNEYRIVQQSDHAFEFSVERGDACLGADAFRLLAERAGADPVEVRAVPWEERPPEVKRRRTARMAG
ncbi:MAG: F390 synthetase-related protein [Dehalococcoidia bacterium]